MACLPWDVAWHDKGGTVAAYMEGLSGLGSGHGGMAVQSVNGRRSAGKGNSQLIGGRLGGNWPWDVPSVGFSATQIYEMSMSIPWASAFLSGNKGQMDDTNSGHDTIPLLSEQKGTVLHEIPWPMMAERAIPMAAISAQPMSMPGHHQLDANFQAATWPIDNHSYPKGSQSIHEKLKGEGWVRWVKGLGAWG
ncbi:hypothetical protein B0J17DRAFT_633185 [Rhizoctonia solani]|nr:hypothetical protein B0J17DRAFT_633185 [Rhizoctonia solani]